MNVRPANPKPAAFTLVELMISIAMVLLLMAGVTAVFKTSTDTIGTGQALGTITRNQRATQHVFDRDFSHAVPAVQQPCIIIHSEQDFAYMDKNDSTSDADGNIQTIDLNNNGVEGEAAVPGENILPWQYNHRNHRLDTVSLFIRDQATPFQRQTGDETNPSLLSQEASAESWVWYGHVRQPDNRGNDPQGIVSGGNYWFPGQLFPPLANDNNLFVNQWILGRIAIVLTATPMGDRLIGGATGSLFPLAMNTPANSSTGAALFSSTGTAWIAPYSRFDVGQGTIRTFVDNVNAAPSVLGPNWYTRLDYRFNCKPFATRSAMPQVAAEEMAMTTPVFQKGVSQFIVEYAGDFITQINDPTNINYGQVVNSPPRANDPPGFPRCDPDGTIDFVYDPATGIRRIRWYGLYRDSTGGAGTPDVVPLRNVLATAQPLPVGPAAFEKFLPNTPAMMFNDQYICAWSPADLNPSGNTPAFRPSLIRIVITLTDPSGRLPEGQTFEYVYALPQQ